MYTLLKGIKLARKAQVKFPNFNTVKVIGKSYVQQSIGADADILMSSSCTALDCKLLFLRFSAALLTQTPTDKTFAPIFTRG